MKRAHGGRPLSTRRQARARRLWVEREPRRKRRIARALSLAATRWFRDAYGMPDAVVTVHPHAPSHSTETRS